MSSFTKLQRKDGIGQNGGEAERKRDDKILS